MRHNSHGRAALKNALVAISPGILVDLKLGSMPSRTDVSTVHDDAFAAAVEESRVDTTTKVVSLHDTSCHATPDTASKRCLQGRPGNS